MKSFLYNPIIWIFLCYAIGQILADYLVIKKKVGWFEDHNYLNDKHTRSIGVLLFGWMVRNSFMGWFNKKLRLKPSSSLEDLQTLKTEMGYAEAGHLVAFYFLLIVNIYFVIIKLDWWYIILFFVINLIFNMYLVLLQQYNKRRIQKLIDRYN